MIDEVIELYTEERKTIPLSFNEKKESVKGNVSIFFLHLY